MIVSLGEAKEWLRIDGLDDDLILNSLIKTSEQYLKNATGVEFDHTNELAKLFCLTLIVDWYENREFVGKADNVRYTIQSLLLQLSYGGVADESSQVTP